MLDCIQSQQKLTQNHYRVLGDTLETLLTADWLSWKLDFLPLGCKRISPQIFCLKKPLPKAARRLLLGMPQRSNRVGRHCRKHCWSPDALPPYQIIIFALKASQPTTYLYFKLSAVSLMIVALMFDLCLGYWCILLNFTSFHSYSCSNNSGQGNGNKILQVTWLSS